MNEEKIIQKFRKIQEEQPALGDYPSLAMAIRGTGINDRMIKRLYDSLISKDEYLKSEREYNIEHLIILAKNS